MNWDSLSDDERLMAERAVAAYRAVKAAGQAAPHGRGMACIEEAIHKEGFDVLRQMVQLGASEHAEAQKKGPAAGPVRAAGR
jgi:hypothetical protein